MLSKMEVQWQSCTIKLLEFWKSYEEDGFWNVVWRMGRFLFFYGVVTILDIFFFITKVIPDLFRKFRKKICKQKKENQIPCDLTSWDN